MDDRENASDAAAYSSTSIDKIDSIAKLSTLRTCLEPTWLDSTEQRASSATNSYVETV